MLVCHELLFTFRRHVVNFKVDVMASGKVFVDSLLNHSLGAVLCDNSQAIG